jgi:thermosome
MKNPTSPSSSTSTSSSQFSKTLKKGSLDVTKMDVLRKNITAAKLVSELVRSTLGPKGMNKLIMNNLGKTVITKDGSTILEEADVQHPAAKAMVEVAKTTDKEVGDGTTSAVILAGALLEKAEELIDKKVHPTIIVDGYKEAEHKAKEILSSISIKVNPKDKKWLTNIARTSMLSKLAQSEASYLAKLVVEAILSITEEQNGGFEVEIDNVIIDKKTGGKIRDTRLMRGMVVDQEVAYSGMPKRVENAKIALLNCQLETEHTYYEATIKINDPKQIQMLRGEEEKTLSEKVDRIVKTGTNVVFCQKAIDDIAQYYFAEAGVLAVHRVNEKRMANLLKTVGGMIVSNIDDLNPKDLGCAQLVEERKVDDKDVSLFTDWVFIEGCKNAKSVTLYMKGGTKKALEEAERAVHDALCAVRDVIQNPFVVYGAGVPEIEVAMKLNDYANKITGKRQLAIKKFAEAFEIIPFTLAESAEMDAIETILELRARHRKGEKNLGINVIAGRVEDVKNFNIFEPLNVKDQILSIATEAAIMILRIDRIIQVMKIPAIRNITAGEIQESEYDKPKR